jgi:hypothetical protein
MGDQLVARPPPVHKHRKTHAHTQTLNIHVLSGIRTHGLGFRASEDSARPRPFGYHDRLLGYSTRVFRWKSADVSEEHFAIQSRQETSQAACYILVSFLSLLFDPEDGSPPDLCLISLDAQRCIPGDNLQFYRNRSSSPRKLRIRWNPHEIVAKRLFLCVDLQCNETFVCREIHYITRTWRRKK